MNLLCFLLLTTYDCIFFIIIICNGSFACTFLFDYADEYVCDEGLTATPSEEIRVNKGRVWTEEREAAVDGG